MTGLKGRTFRKQEDVKRLYLLRHAKSSWGEPHLSDRDRPLAPRGQRAAASIGRHLRSAGMEPEEVVCSTAARARQTLDAVFPFIGPHLTVHFEELIYRADSDELLERLREVSPTVASVMLIGHNPSIQELALTLANEGGGQQLTARARLAEKFPTGALAAFTIPRDEWSALGRCEAHLEDFVGPRDLR
jgi:phosphohistidine phosphatase